MPDVSGTAYVGDLWLSDQPEHRVAGELRFDGENGGRLSLAGSSKSGSMLAGISHDRTFFGRTGRQLVTVAGHEWCRAVTWARCGRLRVS